MALGDLDDADAESGEWLARRRCSESTVVLSNSTDDESALLDQPTGGDADASSSRDLEEEGPFDDECCRFRRQVRYNRVTSLSASCLPMAHEEEGLHAIDDFIVNSQCFML
jgi:hypothetical protein